MWANPNNMLSRILGLLGYNGWIYENSSYENVFKVALGLKVPYKDIQQLFKRMVFNFFLM